VEKRFLFQPKNIIIIFILMAFLMIASALFELYQSKSELFELMEKESHALLESLISATTNSLKSREKLEELYKIQLLNNANFVKMLFEKGEISNKQLQKICEENNIFRINIFNKFGKKIYFSHEREHYDLPERKSPQKILEPIFSGEKDTLIIGITQARFEEGMRYAVALASRNHDAIVINVDAEEIIDFRKEIGIGSLMQELKQNPGIVYVALQDTFNILAATGNVSQLESIQESDFLLNALMNSDIFTRITEFDSVEIFEAVHPFEYNNDLIGLFRLGLSVEPLQDINTRIIRRLIIITIVLIIVGTLLFTFIFVRQRYDILQKQFKAVEAYSSDIVDNVSDAIVVLDSNRKVKVFNKTAVTVFGLTGQTSVEKKLTHILNHEQCSKILKENISMQQFDCLINEKKKYLLISKSEFKDEKDENNTILVIRDLTEQKLLEEQIQRKERLTAMGELASGVAHEIRNPLNTIGTIVQQLNKDFEPRENTSEYDQLTKLVYKEVRRINETIRDFLRFARPEPVNPVRFQTDTLLDQIETQYQSLMKSAEIDFKIERNWSGEVNWDKNQIQQVLMNLLQNAIDAINSAGKIVLSISYENNKNILIRIKDNGAGMDETARKKIFNLYFTTKAKGTGIGLSIVQRIIYEHNGLVSVESEPGKGTVFSINLPVII